jgi:hypothetical protein
MYVYLTALLAYVTSNYMVLNGDFGRQERMRSWPVHRQMNEKYEKNKYFGIKI